MMWEKLTKESSEGLEIKDVFKNLQAIMTVDDATSLEPNLNRVVSTSIQVLKETLLTFQSFFPHLR